MWSLMINIYLLFNKKKEAYSLDFWACAAISWHGSLSSALWASLSYSEEYFSSVAQMDSYRKIKLRKRERKSVCVCVQSKIQTLAMLLIFYSSFLHLSPFFTQLFFRIFKASWRHPRIKKTSSTSRNVSLAWRNTKSTSS